MVVPTRPAIFGFLVFIIFCMCFLVPVEFFREESLVVSEKNLDGFPAKTPAPGSR